MANIQSYDEFVASGMKSEGIKNFNAGPRRIGPQRPLPGRPGKPGRPIAPPSKPKPKKDRPICQGDKING